jgi:hypothetical protein
MAATLTPPGITNSAGTLVYQSTRSAVLDPSGVTNVDGQLHLQSLRVPNFFWSSTISTWQLAGRTFSYLDVDTLGMSLALPTRTYAPAWVGTSVTRTTGQIWPV